MPITLEKAEELNERTKRFAIRIVRLCRALPGSQENKILSNQLLDPERSSGELTHIRSITSARVPGKQ
jgi:hypothetical protein